MEVKKINMISFLFFTNCFSIFFLDELQIMWTFFKFGKSSSSYHQIIKGRDLTEKQIWVKFDNNSQFQYLFF